MSLSLPLSNMYFKVSSLSTTGFVFAIHTTVVNPPFAAAFAPLNISSLYVKPGSLKWTCISISPGATTHPVASIMYSNPSGFKFLPISFILSFYLIRFLKLISVKTPM